MYRKFDVTENLFFIVHFSGVLEELNKAPALLCLSAVAASFAGLCLVGEN
jgi:hypothetical protein